MIICFGTREKFTLLHLDIVKHPFCVIGSSRRLVDRRRVGGRFVAATQPQFKFRAGN